MRALDRDRALPAVLGILILVVLVGMLLGSGMMGSGRMWGYDGAMHMHGWSWGVGVAVGGLGMLALIGILIVGGSILFHRTADQRGGSWDASTEDPRAILRRRYAAGEIDQAGYERMKRELEV